MLTDPIGGAALLPAFPDAREGERVRFSWVRDELVPRDHRRHVDHHVRRIARRHKLGEVRVRYFGPPTRNALPHEGERGWIWDGDFYMTARGSGRAFLGVTPEDADDTIGLWHGLRGEMTAFIVAHELRHLMARRRGETVTDAECDRFAQRYVLGRR